MDLCPMTLQAKERVMSTIAYSGSLRCIIIKLMLGVLRQSQSHSLKGVVQCFFLHRLYHVPLRSTERGACCLVGICRLLRSC